MTLDASRFIGNGPHGRTQFYSLLDEYFARRGPHQIAKATSPPIPASAPTLRPSVIVKEGEKPPPILHRARPVPTKPIFRLTNVAPCQRSCAAEDVAAELVYVTPTYAWWHDNPPQPPSLKNRKDMAWKMSGLVTSQEKTLIGVALFADLSHLWYRIVAPTNSNNVSSARCEAQYTARPAPLDHENAEWAANVYNDSIATFVETAHRTSTPIGNGHCWPLAAEALKALDPSLPKWVPSTGRTHGSLIYQAKVDGNSASGTWIGGDDRIRRGDIIEWMRAEVAIKNGILKLGVPEKDMPEHTAVIVRDIVPRKQLFDGQSLTPAELGFIEFVHQSLGVNPKRDCYDFTGMYTGEIWIYRPCAYEQLGLPLEFEPKWPPTVPTLKPSR